MSGTRIAASLLLVSLAMPLRAQHYGFRLFDRDAGLTNLEIQCLYQDRRGFIWVGTRNGLFRYEGTRFVRFGQEDGLPSPMIEAIHQTADGTLWAGTGAGLARFTGTRFEKVALDWSYQMYGAGSIDSAPDGTLYFSTDRGLVQGRLAAGRWSFSRVRSTQQPAEEPSAGVLARPGGRVWYGCGTRVCIYDGREVSSLGREAGLPEVFWIGIGNAPNGGVCLRNRDHLYVFDEAAPQSRAPGASRRRSPPCGDTDRRPRRPVAGAQPGWPGDQHESGRPLELCGTSPGTAVRRRGQCAGRPRGRTVDRHPRTRPGALAGLRRLGDLGPGRGADQRIDLAVALRLERHALGRHQPRPASAGERQVGAVAGFGHPDIAGIVADV